MPKPIQISIPQPCHEKWAEMTPADKGRFCASCQKTVIDFTRASDREIAQALGNNKDLCGRFIPSQLERDLVVPKEKGSLWAAASAAVITFLTMGSNEASAQTPVSTEQTDKNTHPETFTLTGTVSDEIGPLPGATVFNKDSGNSIQTNIDGNFTINAAIGDSLQVSFPNYKLQVLEISKNCELRVTLQEDDNIMDTVVINKYRTTTSYTTGAVATLSIEDIIARSELRTITGVVSDNGDPLPGASIVNLRTGSSTQTDIDGKYSIIAVKGDKLEYSFICEPYTVKVKSKDVINVKLPLQRTFFVRIFHSIGNWFR